MREAEIVRLGEEAARRGGNVDAMALQHRCGGQEGLILQLTEQVATLQMLATTIPCCTLTCWPCESPGAWHDSRKHSTLGLHDSFDGCANGRISVLTMLRSTD